MKDAIYLKFEVLRKNIEGSRRIGGTVNGILFGRSLREVFEKRGIKEVGGLVYRDGEYYRVVEVKRPYQENWEEFNSKLGLTGFGVYNFKLERGR